MLIGSGIKLKNIRSISHIFMDDNPIKRVKSTKPLGVHIDEELTLAIHIEYISKKISRAIGSLRQARPYVPKTTLITIYKVLIERLFDYVILSRITYLPKPQIGYGESSTGQPA